MVVRDEAFQVRVLGALVEADGLSLRKISRRFKRPRLWLRFVMADLVSSGLAVRDGAGVFSASPIGAAAVEALARKAAAA